MSDALRIFRDESEVGTLTRTTFIYAASWLENGFPLSASLPLRVEPYHARALRWFANLLPEGGTRERLARRLRLSPDDDFALLEALGNDCAGALALLPEGSLPRSPPQSYRDLEAAHLEALLDDTWGLALLQEEGRLSLAGAQDKLPVFRTANGLMLPAHGAPSSHILKLPNRDFGNLVENELLCLRLARAVGLLVAQAEIFFIGQTPALLVERYDRIRREDGALRRLHQEDFVQALGIGRHHKYEQDQGATFAQCVHLLRNTGVQPALEVRELSRWLFFNLIVGNRDNHGKNLARLMVGGHAARWKLAPFYDLVNTTGYKSLTRNLAFRIGGADRIEQVRSPQWKRFAADVGLPVRFVVAECKTMLDRIEEALEPSRLATAEELGDDARLAAPLRAINKSIRLARESVK